MQVFQFRDNLITKCRGDALCRHVCSVPGMPKVRVTLEIEAEIPQGAPDNVVRTATENSRTLKFTASGFEAE
jgi:hypothetical protein